jgi:hypothetical protein
MRLPKSTATFTFASWAKRSRCAIQFKASCRQDMALFDDKDHGPTVLLTGELSPYTTKTAKDLTSKTLDRLTECVFTLRHSITAISFVPGIRLIGLSRLARDLSAAHWERHAAHDADVQEKHASRRPGEVFCIHSKVQGAAEHAHTPGARAGGTSARRGIYDLVSNEIYARLIGHMTPTSIPAATYRGTS